MCVSIPLNVSLQVRLGWSSLVHFLFRFVVVALFFPFTHSARGAFEHINNSTSGTNQMLVLNAIQFLYVENIISLGFYGLWRIFANLINVKSPLFCLCAKKEFGVENIVLTFIRGQNMSVFQYYRFDLVKTTSKDMIFI